MKKSIVITSMIVTLVVFSTFTGCINLNKSNNDSNEYDDSNNIWDNGDNSNGGSDTPKTYQDSDGDGHYDDEDDFPYDSSEWKDSDNDRYGDNIDAFPYDSSEWLDSDGDGYGNNRDVFPYDSSEWKDSDKDNHGDNSDAFPYDPTEWKDSDGDGVGDNSDPFPYDYDNDGYSDSVDIMKDGDAAIKIELEKFNVVDELDYFFTSVEVFFEIYIDGRMEARIDFEGEIWGATVGQTHSIYDKVVYNIADDQRYTDIAIVMWDYDPLDDNDVIDINSKSSSTGYLEITYDADKKTWSGDDNDGYTDGREDGSQNYDDDDGILWYDIDLVKVDYDKTYSWSYNYRTFSLSVDIPPELYAYYSQYSIQRSPSSTSQMTAFVTSGDSVVVEIANELDSAADNRGYDYYEKVNFVLSFVQSLEYTYDNASTYANEYWRFSVETLVDETGDCEDTSILFASLMEAMGYDAVLINVPRHLAVGIWGTEGYPGTYYNYDGRNYYYCETTAEDWVMGMIPSDFSGQSATIIPVE